MKNTYTIDPAHSSAQFTIRHMMITNVRGSFSGVTGTVVFDPENSADSSVDAVIDATTLNTNDPARDGHVKGADFLAVEQFPTITFKSSKVEVTGEGEAKVTGALTIHGVTKKVVLDAKFNAAGPNPIFKIYTVGFEVSGKIKRSDFGVSKYVPVVGDEVTLIISAAFDAK